jgi:F-type H+-transporting ATPase subunit gamma
MSKRRDLETQIHSLEDIREIMAAMRNLALMETHRLARFLDTQRRVVATIEAAAGDFLKFHPHLVSVGTDCRHLHLLVGSERGFCGDFNESLVRAMNEYRGPSEGAVLILLGRKLAIKCMDDPRVAVSLGGAGVVEEVDPVLSRLLEEINSLGVRNAQAGPLRLTVFHHDPDKDGVEISTLRPFKQPDLSTKHSPFPPLLNLEPRLFLKGLAEQYLGAVLHELLYRSLMAENQRRMQHMDGAVRRLERKSMDLMQRRDVLRQEEITQEIEVIMLNFGTLG